MKILGDLEDSLLTLKSILEAWIKKKNWCVNIKSEQKLKIFSFTITVFFKRRDMNVKLFFRLNSSSIKIVLIKTDVIYVCSFRNPKTVLGTEI